MRRILLTLATAAAVGATTLPATAVGVQTFSGAADAERAARPTPTSFAFQASGLGSRVKGADIPVDSTETAFTRIGCTNRANLIRRNFVENATVPGLGRVEGIKTTISTHKAGRYHSSVSRQRIARVLLAESGLGRLALKGLTSASRAINRAGTYQADVVTKIGGIVFTPAAGPAQSLPLPTPDQPLVIPGLASITLGKQTETVRSNYAEAHGTVLVVRLLPAGTVVRLGTSAARLDGGITNGVFAGRSAGLEARALDDNVQLGRQTQSLMPCQGTHGKLERKSTARVDLGGQIVVRGVNSSQRTTSTRRFARANERGHVARISLGEGQLVVNGIVGQAVVTRLRNGRILRKTAGTTPGSVIVDGERQEFPETGVIEVPGLVRLQSGITKRYRNGLRVIGLRVTVLDGTGAVIDLGTAKSLVKPSGLR